MKLLLIAIAAEIVIFTAIAPNFLTAGNLFEITRLSVELGLLAIALTPILVTGGIDLSVGSMMGLAAVVFGIAATDWHLPIVAAAAAAVLVGLAGGALNAVAIAGLGLPPLIVTLGTLSMFRGIAEGVTQGSGSYSGFPHAFLALGQGYLGGIVPAQLPFFLLVLAAYALLLHRSVIGRALYAIGFSASGARHAGLPVERRVGLVYMLSGLTASVAAIIYVAHLGQAKSDAGLGFELDAITAVVLGGTSVFGGRGTLWGTVLGLWRAVHAAERPAACRAALGAHRGADRRAARHDHRARSHALTVQRIGTRSRRGRARRRDCHEEQPGRRALRHRPDGGADRSRHERVDDAHAAAGVTLPRSAARRPPRRAA